MKTYAFKAVYLVLLAMLVTVCSAAEKDSDANRFWHGFRQAVVDNQKEKIVTMTRLPFEVRGPDDSDPVKKLNQRDFLDVYERLVAQSVFLPSGDKIIPKSMRQLIGETTELSNKDFLTPDLIQFHQFEFMRIDDRWCFTRAYLEE
jgi:hypothetical protein